VGIIKTSEFVEQKAGADDTINYEIDCDEMPPRRKRAKKGQAVKQEWKKFKVKEARMTGQSYEGRQGKCYVTKAPRYLAPRCE